MMSVKSGLSETHGQRLVFNLSLVSPGSWNPLSLSLSPSLCVSPLSGSFLGVLSFLSLSLSMSPSVFLSDSLSLSHSLPLCFSAFTLSSPSLYIPVFLSMRVTLSDYHTASLTESDSSDHRDPLAETRHTLTG